MTGERRHVVSAPRSIRRASIGRRARREGRRLTMKLVMLMLVLWITASSASTTLHVTATASVVAHGAVAHIGVRGLGRLATEMVARDGRIQSAGRHVCARLPLQRHSQINLRHKITCTYRRIVTATIADTAKRHAIARAVKTRRRATAAGRRLRNRRWRLLWRSDSRIGRCRDSKRSGWLGRMRHAAGHGGRCTSAHGPELDIIARGLFSGHGSAVGHLAHGPAGADSHGGLARVIAWTRGATYGIAPVGDGRTAEVRHRRRDRAFLGHGGGVGPGMRRAWSLRLPSGVDEAPTHRSLGRRGPAAGRGGLRRRSRLGRTAGVLQGMALRLRDAGH